MRIGQLVSGAQQKLRRSGSVEKSGKEESAKFVEWGRCALEVAHDIDAVNTRIEALQRSAGSRQSDDAPE